MPDSLGVAVLASGSGTNLQAIIEQLHEDPGSGVEVVRIIGSRAGIGALARAERHRILTAVQPAGTQSGDWLLGELDACGARLVVLAGWLRLISPAVVRAFRGRMINIHPALLPSFGGPGMYGRHVHEAVVASGVRGSGATVHFVDEVYDHGAIIAQWPVPVMEEDDAEALAARVLKVEHRLLPAVVRAYAAGTFELGDSGHVEWKGAWFEGDAFSIVRGS
ncbi:MAG: phosphoribosylglycinamide formyltransferase [Gemmatimonadota bacterium]